MPTIVFDCDGVLADTEPYGHLPAFNQTFAEVGLPVQWSSEEYGRLLAIGGGKERMATLFTPDLVASAGLPTDPDARRALLADWHRRKTAIYGDLVRSGALPGRPGVARLMREALDAGWGLAVASTSAEASVRAVLGQVVPPEVVGQVAVFAGDVVAKKKPAPDIYLLAVSELDIAGDAVVVEDSDIGVRAATSAGLPCIVTTSYYTGDQDFTGASLVVSSLGEPPETPTVVGNPLGLAIGSRVSLDDLARCLRASTAVPLEGDATTASPPAADEGSLR